MEEILSRRTVFVYMGNSKKIPAGKQEGKNEICKSMVIFKYMSFAC